MKLSKQYVAGFFDGECELMKLLRDYLTRVVPQYKRVSGGEIPSVRAWCRRKLR